MSVLFIILATLASGYALMLWASMKAMSFGAKHITNPDTVQDDKEFQELKKILEKKIGRNLTQEETLKEMQKILQKIETKVRPRLTKILALVALFIFLAILL